MASEPQRIAWAGLLALAAAMGIGRFAFTPILPMMQDDGLSLAQGGWLASANYVGYLVGALWAMGARARPHVAIRAALLGIALSTLAMGITHSLAAWALLRGAAGVASAWALVQVSSWCLERLAPLRNPRLGGTVFTGVGTGVAVAGGLCLALTSAGAGASSAWLGLGALSLALTAAVWPVLGVDRGRSAAVDAVAQPYRWTPDAVRLVLCYGAFGFGYIIPATFVPAMAKQAIADPVLFGLAWPLFGLAAAASTVLVAPMLRALGPRRLWMLSGLAMALGVASPVLLPGPGGIALAAVLVGSTFMVITMAGMQEARRIAADGAPVLMGAMTAAFAAGQIAGPLAVSSAVERQGFAAALLIASGLLVASAAALATKEKA